MTVTIQLPQDFQKVSLPSTDPLFSDVSGNNFQPLFVSRFFFGKTSHEQWTKQNLREYYFINHDLKGSQFWNNQDSTEVPMKQPLFITERSKVSFFFCVAHIGLVTQGHRDEFEGPWPSAMIPMPTWPSHGWLDEAKISMKSWWMDLMGAVGRKSGFFRVYRWHPT